MQLKQYIYTTINHQLYEKAAFAFCLLYAFLTIISPSISTDLKTGILIMSLPFIAINFKSFKKLTIYKLFLFSIAIQIISWIHSWYVIPDYYKSTPDIKRLTDLFLFICISLWIKGKDKRISLMLFLTVTGFILQALYHNFFHNDFLKGIQGHRVDFGMHNAQFTGMLAAVSIFICSYLSTNIWKKPSRYTLIYQGVLCIYLILSAFILIISQTRQVWLGVIIVLLILPLIITKIYQLNKKSVALLYLIFMICIGFFSQSSIVKNRVMTESQVITNIVEGKLHNIPMTSAGIRVNSWLLASHWIKEHPIIGASTKAIPLVLRTSEEFNTSSLKKFGHLHNYYIETLVAYGILGFGFLITYYYSISKSIINNGDKKTIILFISFLIFWIFINNFESYNSKTLGIFIYTIIISCLYSKFITKKLSQE
ncbi:O-antigen ligase family protein [Vibrio rumoiensis]|uniref:O-antigen ligase family protein n=1 Tax=Vibrio rumoiensis TaxID=76258 RepID=UPI0037493B96